MLAPLHSDRPEHPHLDTLSSHVQACDDARGHTFVLRCIGEYLHEHLGRRIFTTVFAATIVMMLLAACS